MWMVGFVFSNWDARLGPIAERSDAAATLSVVWATQLWANTIKSKKLKELDNRILIFDTDNVLKDGQSLPARLAEENYT